MSFQVTEAFVQEYKANLRRLAQQRGSRLRMCVDVDSYTGTGGKAVEQIGSVNPTKRTSRHADTPLISTPHDARWVYPEDYEWADLIDKQDKVRMLIDPTSAYAINGADAMNRAIDDEIISAALGSAKTGQEGGTTVTATQDGVAIVDSSGSSAMTLEKLIEAKGTLMGNEAVDPGEGLYFVCSHTQIEDLLALEKLTSADYGTVKALVNGEINTFMGFTFIRSERLATAGSTYRRCFAFARSGLHLGLWDDIDGRVSERSDKSYATQVYCSVTCGATRTEGAKVVEVRCDEP